MHLVKSFQVLIKVVSVLVFAFFVFFIPPNVAAQTAGDNIQIIYEKINPDSVIGYPIKRIIEKIEEMKINFFNKKQKVQFMTKLSNVRLAELKYVVDNKKLYFLEHASSRYITNLGLILEELNKDRTDISFVQSNLENQMRILQTIKDKFPSQTAQWLLVQQASDTSRTSFSKVSELSR